jgi:hypothetical protein
MGQTVVALQSSTFLQRHSAPFLPFPFYSPLVGFPSGRDFERLLAPFTIIFPFYYTSHSIF